MKKKDRGPQVESRTNEPKAKFRDELDRFALEHFHHPIGRLNDQQRSDALTLCYLSIIRNQLLPGSVPDDLDELERHICDKHGDRFADFIFRDDNNHVTIIQTKHRSPEKLEDEKEFVAFQSCLRNLCPETKVPNVRINQAVLDQIGDIDWESDTFTLIFLSLARHSDTIHNLASLGIVDIPNTSLRDISNRSELRYLSEDEINKEYRVVLARQSGVAPSVQILLSPVDEGHAYLKVENTKGIRSFLGAMDAPQIFRLFDQYHERLFNLNIRNYIGDTKTNKGMIESAVTDADNFFLYNNGISAVARKVTAIEREGQRSILECTDFSIINGAQTFRSIAKAKTKDDHNRIKELRVLIRVSELDYERPDKSAILHNITLYNNTQNAMKLSDFRSNDPVQISLVKYVSEVPAFKGRRYQYKNKRTEASDRNKIAIKMDDFCRAIFAYQFGPVDSHGGLSHLYDTSPTGGYTKLFGMDLDQPLSKQRFERLFGVWLLSLAVIDYLKAEKADREAREEEEQSEERSESEADRNDALERKYLPIYAMGEIIRETCRMKNVDEDTSLRQFSDPSWQIHAERREFVATAIGLGCDLVVQTYQNAKEKPNFTHRNFFRDPETLTSISRNLASRRSELQRLTKLAAGSKTATPSTVKTKVRR